MQDTSTISTSVRLTALLACALVIIFCAPPITCWGQVVRCDPQKVMTAEACARCHVNEVQSWKNTPHYRTFDELGRLPEAKQICSKLGLRSVKRSNECIACHFTTQNIEGRNKPVSGVSCESCHGASADWLAIHNDYGGPTATKQSESAAHAQERLSTSMALGMQNTRNLYEIASSCLNCHTVPNEQLVNVGGHKAGSEDFELVRWSQGQVRHNFLRTGGTSNAVSDPARIRVMFIVGLLADLEYSTRATATATSKSTYGIKVANRAARTAVKLFECQQKIQDPNVQRALQAFSTAELRLNNATALLKVADDIQAAGKTFAAEADGTRLSLLDPWLPNPSQYK